MHSGAAYMRSGNSADMLLVQFFHSWIPLFLLNFSKSWFRNSIIFFFSNFNSSFWDNFLGKSSKNFFRSCLRNCYKRSSNKYFMGFFMGFWVRSFSNWKFLPKLLYEFHTHLSKCSFRISTRYIKKHVLRKKKL